MKSVFILFSQIHFIFSQIQIFFSVLVFLNSFFYAIFLTMKQVYGKVEMNKCPQFMSIQLWAYCNCVISVIVHS